MADPLSATDLQVSQFADNYFEYEPVNRRVTREIVAGGTLATSFSYSTAPIPKGTATGRRKTVETRSDGAQTTVYTNFIGQVLVKEFKKGSDNWIEHQKFDYADMLSSSGRCLRH